MEVEKGEKEVSTKDDDKGDSLLDLDFFRCKLLDIQKIHILSE